MQSGSHPLARFAIFRDSELIERGGGDADQAKARLEHYSNVTPDHNWWFVTYEGEGGISAPPSRTIH